MGIIADHLKQLDISRRRKNYSPKDTGQQAEPVEDMYLDKADQGWSLVIGTGLKVTILLITLLVLNGILFLAGQGDPWIYFTFNGVMFLVVSLILFDFKFKFIAFINITSIFILLIFLVYVGFRVAAILK